MEDAEVRLREIEKRLRATLAEVGNITADLEALMHFVQRQRACLGHADQRSEAGSQTLLSARRGAAGDYVEQRVHVHVSPSRRKQRKRRRRQSHQ